MFSKGKKQTNGSSASQALPAETGGGAMGGRTGGAAGTRRAASGVPSIISADLTIEGNLISHGDVQIDGTVRGDIRSRTLTLGEHAQVEGGVQAETVRICGEVIGEVHAKTVVLTKTAKVTGDILHESLAVEAGAFIDGHCRRVEGGTETARRLPESAAPAPALANGEAKASETRPLGTEPKAAQ